MKHSTKQNGRCESLGLCVLHSTKSSHKPLPPSGWGPRPDIHMSNWVWLLALATELPLTQCKYIPRSLEISQLLGGLSNGDVFYFCSDVLFYFFFLVFYRACQFYVNFKYYSRGGLFAGTIGFMTVTDRTHNRDYGRGGMMCDIYSHLHSWINTGNVHWMGYKMAQMSEV